MSNNINSNICFDSIIQIILSSHRVVRIIPNRIQKSYIPGLDIATTGLGLMSFLIFSTNNGDVIHDTNETTILLLNKESSVNNRKNRTSNNKLRKTHC